MPTDDLRKLSRSELVTRAEGHGVSGAATMTKAELVEAIRAAVDPDSVRKPRTWFGRARDLVAKVVEQGLHLPDAAKVLRSAAQSTPEGPPPLPTVTLAEIYAAQGYHERALGVVDAVLERAPDHAEALALRKRLQETLGRGDEAPASEPPVAETPAAEPEPEPPPEPGPAPEAATTEEPASDASDDAPPPPQWDDVVALATDPRTIYVYWEVRAVTYARARWRHPGGQLVLRVLSLAPGHGDSQRRDIPIDELVGDTFVAGLAAGSEVRVAIGWCRDDDFLAIGVAPEVTMPRDYAAPAVANRRATMSEAAEMRRAARDAEGSEADAPSPGGAGRSSRPGLVRAAGRRLEDVAAGELTSVVQLPDAIRRVRRVRFGGASDLLVDEDVIVVPGETIIERSLPSRQALAGRAGGASDLAYGGASDLQRAAR